MFDNFAIFLQIGGSRKESKMRCPACRHMEPGHNDWCLILRARKLYRKIEERLKKPEAERKAIEESRIVEELVVP